jgi:hypothetical protein
MTVGGRARHSVRAVVVKQNASVSTGGAQRSLRVPPRLNTTKTLEPGGAAELQSRGDGKRRARPWNETNNTTADTFVVQAQR